MQSHPTTMDTSSIKKQIMIRASKQTVWKVVFDEEYTYIWYGELSLGAQVESTWEEGSKVLFTDLSGGGIIGQVTENKPYEKLSVKYRGVVNAGEEDFHGESADLVQGGSETYSLLQEKGKTQLTVELYTPEGTSEAVSAAWERALIKIKELAEGASA